MSSLPQAPDRWSQEYQNRLNNELDRKDRMNRKTGANIDIGKEKLILRSPNGSQFALTVSNSGVLSTTPV